jgi:hypothetical protein
MQAYKKAVPLHATKARGKRKYSSYSFTTSSKTVYDVSEVRAASIWRVLMEAARTSETSVDIQLRTWQYIPEDSELLIKFN